MRIPEDTLQPSAPEHIVRITRVRYVREARVGQNTVRGYVALRIALVGKLWICSGDVESHALVEPTMSWANVA